jgi:hypothetical protein
VSANLPFPTLKTTLFLICIIYEQDQFTLYYLLITHSPFEEFTSASVMLSFKENHKFFIPVLNSYVCLGDKKMLPVSYVLSFEVKNYEVSFVTDVTSRSG